MDSDEERINNKGFKHVLFRFIMGVVVPILAFCLLSFMIGLIGIAFFVGELSISSPVSVPSQTQCKIVSSSVDLRSSKVCELGVLNYKAKNVFYPLHTTTRFRCHYDYYWASIFQVEYKHVSLGQTIIALAEAPDEALPHYCRPNFGAAWLTKDIFKVNQTYDCWYTSGISKVSLYRDGFFSCQAKYPSKIEMIKRYSILSTKIVRSWFVINKGKAQYWRWETVAGVVTGFSTSLISISFIRILQQMKSWLPQTRVARMVSQAFNNIICFKCACFLVAYISVMGWLAIQYVKMLGLPKIFTHYNS